MDRPFDIVGQRVPRKDALEKVTGTARYIPDIQLPKMLITRFLRSPHAHARIRDIDTSKAEVLPGVLCVLSHRNVPQLHPHRRIGFLLDETVHYQGEEVAAVAAVSAPVAEEALKLIEVDYEVLPAVFDPQAALEEGATLAHQELGSNIFRGTDWVKIPRMEPDGRLVLEHGNVEKGMAEADVVLEGDFETPMQYNLSPSPRAVICEWAGNQLTCWADTQLPLNLWRDLANSFKLPMSQVRVISHYAVGGYGGKSPEKIATLAAIMARRTDRPVKAVFSRTEDFVATHHRISYDCQCKVGLKKNGTITAVETKILAHWGSDSSSPFTAQAAGIMTGGSLLYRTPNTRAEAYGVLTNTVGYGAMNGFGTPESVYPLERLIDEAAEAIGMDPVEFRIINCPRFGDKAMDLEKVMKGPVEWSVLGREFDRFPDLIRTTAERAGWKEKWLGWRTPMSADRYKRRGIGVAKGMHHTSFWPSSAIVKMNQDGTANVLSMAVEIGQGYATVISQVVSETLGIRYEDVHPILSDTATAPTSYGNVGSTGTSSPVNAARIAAEDVRRKLFELAAAKLDVPVEALEARDRKVIVKNASRFVSIPELCLSNWQITGVGNNPPSSAIKDPETGKTIGMFAAAVAFAEVEVDIQTGKVELLRITAGHDTGRTINPVMVENQIDLGLIMASGWMLSEEYQIDNRNGSLMSANMVDYKVPTFLDVPRRRDVHKVVMENPCAWGPYGAKGFSETAITALPPAIANAVYNAVGVRIRCGSMTARHILNTIEAADKR